MSRVNNTGGAGFTVDNGTGLVVRTKLNQIIAALSTVNQGSGDPSIGVAAYVPHIDGNTLKIRNAANNAFVSLGDVSLTNFGHAALTGATFTGKVIHNYTSSVTVPVGNTAARDNPAAVGMFRYNNQLNVFEGYKNTGWGEIGGGGGATGAGGDQVFFESDQNVTTSYELTASKHAHTVSPTINNGVTVTVPNNAILVIL